MISLEQVGSFFVGGRRVRIMDRPAETVTYSAGLSDQYDPNGTYLVESAYVQFFLPTARRFETPILLVHGGGGLTGAQWENTPGGRPGWLTRFLEAGVACYVIDNVERGRAGFCSIDGVSRSTAGVGKNSRMIIDRLVCRSCAPWRWPARASARRTIGQGGPRRGVPRHARSGATDSAASSTTAAESYRRLTRPTPAAFRLLDRARGVYAAASREDISSSAMPISISATPKRRRI